ncbi:hypothetical protein TI39_contig4314g00001 [Zymoseptoria brevis]|uniref:Uncharacterized protein n=1 Tax=Zymoseptoria brevis TaxID=1047168 RepID=A0A0F4G806_9PEZI|nr:hypothetical protein TI39_contig4314g00001 [Zymoseptoria brevis]
MELRKLIATHLSGNHPSYISLHLVIVHTLEASSRTFRNPHGNDKEVVEKRDDGYDYDFYYAVPAAERAKFEKRSPDDGYDYDFYYVVPAAERAKFEKRSPDDGYDYDFYYAVPAAERAKFEKRSPDDGYDYDFYYAVPAAERAKFEKRAVKLASKENE